jgi:hypothetical protein
VSTTVRIDPALSPAGVCPSRPYRTSSESSSKEAPCHSPPQGSYGLLGHDETPALDHVLDFFDTVGLLVRLKAIGKDMRGTRSNAGSMATAKPARRYSARRIRASPTQWQDFEALRADLDKLEAARASSKPMAAEEQHGFLVDEIQSK